MTKRKAIVTSLGDRHHLVLEEPAGRDVVPGDQMGCFPKRGAHSSANATAVPGECTSPRPFAERHYTVAEVAEMWNLSPDAVRGLFKNEPGVLIFKDAGPFRAKRRYTTLRIPASVVERVYRRLSQV